ncbi:outer membrane beta-barrel protein [Hymenobacter sp. YC55]|uniref:outer membrane beta-barrel protein n=1 Tax=Hymenobacter sp. YC55 TaxID=3034019 RepID=UPI0023F8A2B2|nr:outer membrane beta-barrel protein [Hymenobacter sp. YC55]MDF7810873.1 outer membrane beta-barrel protein [Hymenobacter sp. YC55]
MTERESKEFYDELRRKLEDYGSPPPESVWAGIRQQVPVKRRRWWRGGLVVLLLTGIVAYLAINTRTWRQETGKHAASSRSEYATGITSSSTTHLADSAHPATPATKPISAQESTTATSATYIALSSPTAQTASENAPSGSQVSRRKQTASDVTLAAPKLPHRLSLAQAVTDSSAQLINEPASTTTKRRVTPSETLRPTRNQPLRQQTGKLVASSSAKQGSVSRSVNKVSLAASAAKSTRLPVNAVQKSVVEASTARILSLATQSATSGLGAEAQVAFKPIYLHRLPFGEPVVQPVAVDSVAKAPRFQRWSVEVLAGPAVSYRRLGATHDSTPGNQLRQLERAALTYAAQAQLRYAFTPRLAVSVGLGYTQYATQLNYVLRRRGANDSLLNTEELERYDTYRYLTVPVQVRYMLGQQGRFQYSVLGGGSLGLYVGGRTSVGTACACEQQRWTSANSPFQPVSLAIKGGFEVRYLLAPGWSVLAQPYFQYGIQNISKPETGPSRYPFVGGLLTGFSYNLR